MSDNVEIVKRKAGRPQKFNKEQIEAIKLDFNEYIDRVDDPTIAGFIATHPHINLQKDYLLQRKEFSLLVRRAIAKQEAFLLGMHKNPTMAIFRLKQPQHGYSDKTEVQNTNVNINVKADMTVNKDFTAFLKQKTIQQ